jgi:multiple sugar transport system permease protein
MGRVLAIVAILLCSAAGATDVSFFMCYRPTHPEDPTTKALVAFEKAHPDIHPKQWGGLILPGGGGRAQFMLALAGGSAPDVYKAWFHILRHDIDQGFTYPLDEWIDVKWEGWKESPALWREVATKDGHIYAVPTPGMAYYGLVYRKDLVKEAGLDPETPPATWDEFERWCERLTKPGRRALAVENRPWGFLPWVGAAGGDVVRRKGDDEWEACFDAPECLRAAEFLQRLVRKGLVRGLPVLTVSSDVATLFTGGQIACVFGGEDLVAYLTENLNFPADRVGLMPFPAADASLKPVLQAHKHFYAMTESVAHRPKEERDKVWAAMSALASRDVYDEQVRRNALEGRARWCMPSDLKRLGLERYLDEVPPGIKRMYADLEAGRIRAVTEPHVGFWQAASDIVSRRFLGILLSDMGPDMDCGAALRSITADANRGLMFDADRSRIEAKRPLARVIFGIAVCVAIVIVWMVLGARRRRENAPARGKDANRGGMRRALLPWLFLAPAVLSVALWSYYPLVKGAVMAFQNYRIVGGAGWAGLDNFIRVASDLGFWKAWGRTLQYVAITIALGFTAPVILAVLLTEIPKGKVFFRMVYFLPHLTSALVVMLLWKLMFDPTESGMLNQLLAAFGIARHAWLQDPSWAMTCCILPGVWAGAGMASLIYIAALGSLPPDYYEAAAIDGAGIFARFRHITFPQLLPLMVINFVGAFIAAFQGMGSIFLLTFGGPGDATNVLSLMIWKEAYNNLRFSTATTMAWFLGVALGGFPDLQIRFLRRVEFRRAAAN